MNSFSLNAVTIQFDYPWLLLLLIPAVALMLWPYFRLPKQVRKTRNRIISLVLHSVMLTLLVFMISGMTVTTTEVDEKNDVILLVDLSDSNKSSEEDMNEFINAVLKEQKPNYRVGIVTFANGTVYASKLNKDGNAVFDSYTNASVPLGNATNIAEALFYARDTLSNPENGRIILLSDGVQTDGNALSAVKSVANNGTRVDTVFFSFAGRDREVLVSGLDVPQRANLNDILEITVKTRSASAGLATLTLYDNNEFFDEMEVNLTGGEDSYTFRYQLLTPNLHEFRVEIASDGDTLEENNTYYSYINIDISTNVLIVDGTGNESEAISGLLNETYETTIVSPENLPTTINELCKYDQVIFMNVANADLPAGFDGILTEYVEEYGGGFFTVGGDKAYVQSDMEGSKFEDLLPVESGTDGKSLGLLLVIDCSSSMTSNAVGTSVKRIDLAKEAAIACLDVLGPDDYVGVIGFNTANPADIQSIPMRSIEQKDAVIQHINSLHTASGTYYSTAINAVVNTITSFDKTDLKHIIFLADGTTNESAATIENQVYPRINQLANRGITTSTIALGPDSVGATTYLENFARLGKGEFYSVTDERLLKQYMVSETERVAGEYSNEITFTPIVDNRTPAVAGIDELPELNGFYGAKLKRDATSVLVYDANPIYAEWTRGKGRVGSFMSDLSGKWSAAFLADGNGVRFILNVVSGLFSKEATSDYDSIRAEFVQDNFTTRVSITTDVATSGLTAELIAPDGSRRALPITKLSDRAFVGTFHMDQSGLYGIVIDNGTEQFTLYTTFSYSAEYDVFVDETVSFEFLESLSRNGNGSMLFSAENIFERRNQTVESTTDLQLPFIIACIVLFLLDIFVRKFKIKLPKEIREERRAKAEATTGEKAP